MTRILIPRSDNLSAKIVTASDFEKYFNQLFNDYVITGFCASAQCPNVLAVDITAGTARVKGLHLESTTCCTITCLTVCATNFLYIGLCRDACTEPDEWTFSTNTTGTLPTDSLQIGTATTNACSVTAVDNTLRVTESCNGLHIFCNALFGDGSEGDHTVPGSPGTETLSETKYYENLTIPACRVLTSSQPMIIFVKGTLTLDGNITMNGLGGCGGAAGITGPSAPGSPGASGTTGPPRNGGPGGPGGCAGSAGDAGTNGSPAAAGGAGGSGGSGGGGGPGGGGGSGGTGGPATPGSGGGGGAAGTLNRSINNIFDWFGEGKITQIGAGAGGAGRAARGSGGGGGAGGSPFGGGTGGAGGQGGLGGAAGGAGGAGGGTAVILAKKIIIACGSSISADGIDGACGANNPGASVNGNNGGGGGQSAGGGGGGGGASGNGGGGGAGGAGGILLLYTSDLTDNNPGPTPGVHADGGAPGTGGTANPVHGTGGSGGPGGGPGPNPAGSPGGSGGASPGPTAAGTPGAAGGAGVAKNVLI